MAFLTIVQTAILPHFPIFGLIPQLPFLVALAWGMLRGVDEGILWAFIGGFFLDLFSLNPLGITALAFMIAILAVIWMKQIIATGHFFMPVLLAGLASLIAMFLYLFFLRLLGHQTTLQVAATLPPVALLHAGLVLPVYWVMYVIDRTIRPRRVTV
jgi:rod shape-determining protein MreD